MRGGRLFLGLLASAALVAGLSHSGAALAGGGCGPGDEYCLGPVAEITKAPDSKTTKRRATFKFKSPAKRARFRCALDNGPFNHCKSPKKLRRLKPGDHVFRVQAVSNEGVGGVPARYRWTVIPIACGRAERGTPGCTPPPPPDPT